jgi:RHS repeat-associated protein
MPHTRHFMHSITALLRGICKTVFGTSTESRDRTSRVTQARPQIRVGWFSAAMAVTGLLLANAAHAACGFNIDRLAVNDPSLATGEFTSDGLLIVRSLQNLTGSALIAGTRVDQTPVNQASVVATIQNHMTTYRASHDMDASGFTDVTDGIIIARYLAGYRGDSLVQGLTLTGTRTAGTAIESYITGGCTTPSLPLTCTLSGPTTLNVGQSGTVNVTGCTSGGNPVTGVTFNWTPSSNLSLGANCTASSTACAVTATNGGSGNLGVISTKAGYTGSSVSWPITLVGVNNSAPQAGALSNITTTNGGRAVVGSAYTLRLPVTDATGALSGIVTGLSGATVSCSAGNPSNCDTTWTPSAAGLYASTISITDTSGAVTTQRTTIAVQQTPAAEDVSVTPNPAGGIPETALVGKVAGSFSVSEGGSAGYSIPIQVPPGTNGLQPSLSLGYSSGGSYGMLGIGWNLSGLGSITRCQRTIAQDGIRDAINYDNQENNDAYCLGGQRLMPVTALVSGGTVRLNYVSYPSQDVLVDKQEFRTEIDNYARIIGYKEWPKLAGPPPGSFEVLNAAGFSRFTVETKDGRIMHYSRRFKVLSNGRDACSDVNNSLTCPGGEESNRIKLFVLDRVEDTAGNVMNIEYHTTRPSNPSESTYVVDWDATVGTITPLDVGGNSSYPPTEVLPKVIKYSNGHEVRFVYDPSGHPAAGQIRSFDSGAGESVTTQRLNGIETYADGVLAKRYAMTYDTITNSPTQRSRIIAVTECHGAGVDTCLPATNFQWQGAAITAFANIQTSASENGFTQNGAQRLVGDIKGTGRASMVMTCPSGAGLNCVRGQTVTWLRVCDMVGGTSSASGNLVCETQYLQTTNLTNTDANTYLADVNGDGKADLVYGQPDTGNHYVCLARADGTGFSTNSATPTACTLVQLQQTVTGGLLQGDFNGDGRIDILAYRPGNFPDANGVPRHKFDLYLGQATGSFALSGSHYFPSSEKERQQNSLDQGEMRKRFFVADFNGDGAADLLQYAPNIVGAGPQNRWRQCYARQGNNASDVRFDCPRDIQTILAGAGVATPAPVPELNAPIQCTVAQSALPTATWQIRYVNRIESSYDVPSQSSATVLNNGTCATSSSVTWSAVVGGDNGGSVDGTVTNQPASSCTNQIGIGIVTDQPTLGATILNQQFTVTRSGGSGNLVVSINPLTGTTIQGFTVPAGVVCSQSKPATVQGPTPAQDGSRWKSEETTLVDFNGDGLADIAMPVDTNVKNNGNWTVCLSTGDGGFERFTGVNTRTSTCKQFNGLVYANGDAVVTGDFDGDGRTDLLGWQDSAAGSRGWQIAYARGSASGFAAVADSIAFSRIEAISAGAPADKDIGNYARVGDFNGDGISDLGLRTGAGGAIRMLSPTSLSGNTGGARQEMVNRITDGLGSVTEIDYTPITDDNAVNPVYVKNPTIANTPLAVDEVDVRSPMQVVKEIRADNGLNCAQGTANCAWHTTKFKYYGLRGSINGRGMMGFSQRDVTESFGGYISATSQTAYNNELAKWWLAGSVKQAIKTHPNALEASKRLSDASMTYHLPRIRNGFVAPGAATPKIYEVFASGSTQLAWDLNGAVLPTQSTTYPSWDTTVTGANLEGYDQDGNVLRSSATTSSTVASVTTTHTKASKNTYAYRLVDNPASSIARGNWILGRLTRSEVTHTKSGAVADGGGSITRVSAFAYYGDSALSTVCKVGVGNSIDTAPAGYVCDEIVEPDFQNHPDDAALWSSTRHRYDAFGNRVKSVTSFKAPLNQGDTVGFTAIQTRDSGTTTFDAKGRYPTTVANALGHSETRVYDARFGVMTDLIGPNGLLTKTQLDAFGRKIRERSFAGNTTGSAVVSDASTYTQSCSGVADPTYGSAADCVAGENHRKRTRVSGGGTAIVFYDKLQREMRTKSQTYLTNLAATSATANEWVVASVTYDERGRKRTSVKPAGDGTATTTMDYDDLDRVTQDSMLGNNGAPTTPTITATTTTAYNGLTTTVTRKKAATDPSDRADQVTTRIVDSQGKPLTITDALLGNTRFVHDAVGNLKSVTAPTAQNQTGQTGLTETMLYDTRGRRIYMESPQGGSVFTLYNGIGEVIRNETQRITTVNTYDNLGRATIRVDREGSASTSPTFTTTWTYDAGSQCGQRTTGKLCIVTTSRANYAAGSNGGVTPNGAVSETKYTYDLVGRVERTESAMNLSSAIVQGDPSTGPKRFATTTFYDTNARPERMGTAGGVIFRNQFAAWNGSLFNVTDASGVNSYWNANSRFQDGQIKSMNVGGSLGINASAFQTIKTLDGLGRIDTIKTGNATSGTGSTNVQNANYDIDSFGNLVARSDAPTGGSGGAAITITASETYQYDALNRVTGKNGTANSVATYDALGNIQTKNQSAAGTFVYETAGTANYRLKTYAGRTYVYDGDGNVTNDGLRTISYAPWNLPWRATRGSNSLSWDYDHARSRTIERSTTHGTTFFAGGFELVVPNDSNATNPKTIERTYIPTPEGVVGVLTRTAISNNNTTENVTSKTEYWHKDHIGSLVATTDQTGAVTQRFRFEPWGGRECLSPTTGATQPCTSGGGANNGNEERGFTGHEMLDEIGLIHMNGRLYDPEIGRFLQADPIIQEPLNGQNYNRYAYVQNNPLSYTDPTGFSWWTKWRKPLLSLVAMVAVPWAIQTIAFEMGSAAAAAGGADAVGAVIAGAEAKASVYAASLVAGGAAAGGIQGGNVQSAVIGAFTAGAQFGVGEWLGHSTPSLFSGGAGSVTAAQKLFAHAAIGCASAAASGGSCRSGAAAAGFSSFAGGSIPGANNLLGRAAAGAIASKLAGGKAEQGALLAAMEYLYNEAAEILAANKLQAAIAESGAVAAHTANGARTVLTNVGITVTDAAGKSMQVIADYVAVYADRIVIGEVKSGLGARLSLSQGAMFEAAFTGRAGSLAWTTAATRESVKKALEVSLDVAKIGLTLDAAAGSRALRQLGKYGLIGVAGGLSILASPFVMGMTWSNDLAPATMPYTCTQGCTVTGK